MLEPRWRALQSLHDSGTDCVVITVTGVRGSVPCDPGGKAIVTADGLFRGTVGGGKIEARALSLALELLADSSQGPCHTRVWNLQQDIGMTCGGEMTLLFEIHRARAPWRIFLFGAGHIVRALVPVLTPLACRITVFDTRPDLLHELPAAPNLVAIPVSSFEDGVPLVPADGFVLSITQGHSTDFPVLRDLLRLHPALPFIGTIGSRSKRAVLTRELLEAGISEETIATLVCPLGLPLGGNAPEEIAISIAAQLLQVRGE